MNQKRLAAVGEKEGHLLIDIGGCLRIEIDGQQIEKTVQREALEIFTLAPYRTGGVTSRQ